MANDWFTCIHEAAHVATLAHYGLLREIERIEMDGDCGRVVIRDSFDPFARNSRKRVMQACVMYVSGYVAETQLLYPNERPSLQEILADVHDSTDLVIARRIARHQHPDFLHQAAVIAERILQLRPNWRIVTAVAEELVNRRTLSGPAVRRLIHNMKVFS